MPLIGPAGYPPVVSRRVNRAAGQLPASFTAVRIFDAGLEAHGVIAVGQIATGVIAIGQFATGVIAIGQVARGVIALGQLAVGIAGAGQIGAGVLYGAGMVGIGAFAGGFIPLGPFGRLRVLRLLRGEEGWAERVRPALGLIVVWAAAAALIWFGALGPLGDALFARGGILYVPR